MEQQRKILLVCMATTAMLGTGIAVAGQVEVSSSLNPVGSGARATGMGGAFIAVADDATAASWNPAGLIHLEKPEASIVYSYFNRGQTTRISDPGYDVKNQSSSMDAHDINFASIAYPFQLFNRNMVVTLNYQQLYNMNKNVTTNLTQTPSDVSGINIFSQKGFLSAISPAIAIQVLPELYFGATVNIWDDFADTCSWKSSNRGSVSLISMPGLADSYNQVDTKYSFSGLNANLGLIYNLKNKYSFGVVYKTPFTADLDVTRSEISTNNAGTTIASTKEKQKMNMPASYGVGFAYRHSDNLSMAFDIYRTEWSRYTITDANGNKQNPISGNYISVGSGPTSTGGAVTASQMGGRAHDTTQVRLGGEYLIIGDKMTVPVRAGVFYDPEPGQVKVDDFFGFSLGSGVAYGKYAFDVSYQYRWGNRVSGDIQNPAFSADIHQHTVMSSLIYHF